ncbi:MAG: pyridoxine 5'-phosphate synthase [Xanthomonadales bacterium]|nr:pyridoxine 5'-phosphate synthase [Xanthomonadales bacterium]
MTALSVNLNKIAVLRNSRGGEFPDILKAARTCFQAGCQGITVHPRPDARHVRADDVRALAGLLTQTAPAVEFNIEGNPFAPPREGYPGLLALVEETRPAQCTLVPDSDGQLTSDHGFDLARDAQRLAPLVAQLKALGSRVSVFVDAGELDGLAIARQIGIDRIEIYTGPFAEAVLASDPALREQALAACVATATAARELGLAVNAGHDLDLHNLPLLVAAIPWLAEVSIGHALIDDALYLGLEATVKAYLQAAAPV